MEFRSAWCKAAATLAAATSIVAHGAFVDSSFGAGGVAPLAETNVFREGPAGSYLVGRVRYTAAGQLDLAYGTGGRIVLPEVARSPDVVGLDSHGRLVLATRGMEESGEPDVAGGYLYARITRVTTAGVLDTTFGDGGFLSIRARQYVEGEPCRGGAYYTQVVPDGDGFFLVGLRFYDDNWGFSQAFVAIATWECIAIAKVRGDGTLDAGFGNGGVVEYPLTRYAAAASAARDLDGALLITGLTASEGVEGTDVSKDVAFFRMRLSAATGSMLAAPVVTPVPDTFSTGVQYDRYLKHLIADPPRIDLLAQAGGWVAASLPYSVANAPLRIGMFDTAGAPVAMFASGAGIEAKLPADVAISLVAKHAEGGAYALGRVRPGQVYFCRWFADGVADASVGPGGCTYQAMPVAAEFNAFIPSSDGSAIALADNRRTFSGQAAFGLVRLNVSPRIVEFHNTILDHYFLTYDGAEARYIDGGGGGPGWERTGQGFTSGGTTAACRFYGTPGVGPNSHFYTLDAAECASVKQSFGWNYEGLGFYATPLDNGACAAGLVTIYRVYNQRAAQNDSNHRYLSDLSLVAAMQARGWALEGPTFCARP